MRWSRIPQLLFSYLAQHRCASSAPVVLLNSIAVQHKWSSFQRQSIHFANLFIRIESHSQFNCALAHNSGQTIEPSLGMRTLPMPFSIPGAIRSRPCYAANWRQMAHDVGKNRMRECGQSATELHYCVLDFEFSDTIPAIPSKIVSGR
jgi:hypothetical protein